MPKGIQAKGENEGKLEISKPKPTAYLSMKYKKDHVIVSQKFEFYLIKSMKYGSQIKSFQSKCKHIGE